MTRVDRLARRGATTAVFGIIGHPVAHSLSPTFQNAAFDALGMDACYLAFDVSPPNLEAALAGATALGVAGLNVTVPHKERALQLADETDPLATLIGAANTLVAGPRGWRAHNTDAEGFLKALERDLQFRPEGRRALVVGAGGAARAAAVALLQEGIQEIVVANRNSQRAARLVEEVSIQMRTQGIRAIASGDRLPTPLGAGDLIVDATPAGLQGEAPWPWNLCDLGEGFAVFDMAYRSGETPLVERARAAGFRAASGKRMLLYQGAAAFTLWTGVAAPLDAMERALKLSA